jgi:hypothetical protein
LDLCSAQAPGRTCARRPGSQSSRRKAPEGTAKLKAEWVAARRNHREPAVLTGARFEPIGVKPEESQFLGSSEAGFLTVNEVRALEDRGPLPEGGAAVA